MADSYDLRSGIIATANALGMDPVDLATLIHYESGFNPNVWGGSGGRHYGLIQFGPTERQQYGVKVGDISSQLGPNGAIVKYMTDRGFKPGMGMLDAYSTINAGRPGLYNASDAAAGGQPGTVQDKVTQQMADDRERAIAFLGEGYAGSYDPRLDAPSTGKPVGSKLPGVPVGYGGVDAPADKARAPTTTTTTKKKGFDWGKFGESISDASMDTGKAAMPYQTQPSPAAAVASAPAAPMVNPEMQKMQRERLAQALALLQGGGYGQV
jgi:hypothetical protein